MLARRIVVCLDVNAGRVVKGVQFAALRDLGDPIALASAYEAAGADEIVFLDISASVEQRSTMLRTVQSTAERLFIPLTVGGGIRSVEEMGRALRAGADKVSVNSSAVADPALITAGADRFGSQCIVASIDARAVGSSWVVYTHGGRTVTHLDAVSWAQECVHLGAGEILLTSIDRDGGRSGYDLDLTRAVSNAVSVPVIASGGAGGSRDVQAAITGGGADAALIAGILHEGLVTVSEIKTVLREAGIPVRAAA